MHFLTSLIIFAGFVFACCLGLVKVIWDLSEMSVHASPHMLATPHSGASRAEDGHANAPAACESIPTELSET
jgi:hypothetical protein